MDKSVIIDNVIHGLPSNKIPDISVGQYILDRLQNPSLRGINIYPQTGEVLTNHELLERSVRLANALEERGIKVGDTIAISSENIPNWFVAVCATIFRGATITPMNPAYCEGEIRHCLNISHPKIIFVSQKSEGIIKKVVNSLNWHVELIQLENKSINNDTTTVGDILKNIQDLTDPYKFKAVNVSRPREQEVIILYSSGTTGLPKGVMLSHYNVLVVLFYFRNQQYTNSYEKIIYLTLLPYFHGYGFIIQLFTITHGIKCIILQSFEPQMFCKSIQKYQVTSIPLVPPIMIFLAKHPMVKDYNLSSIKEILCGAASLSKDVTDDVLRHFKNRILIRHGYGMTELSVIICISSRDTQKAESIGGTAPGTSCKIIEPKTSKALEAYQIGELCFKGDHVMLGYKNDPQATNESIKDGWLHTGDLGYYDTDGHLYITGRLKELIKYKGFQISPAEIENILLSHSDVDDAAVIGRNCEQAGEIPIAFVVKKINSTLTAKQLRQYVDERVSPQKHLRGGVQFVRSIPKNPAGKILRKELQQMVSKL